MRVASHIVSYGLLLCLLPGLIPIAGLAQASAPAVAQVAADPRTAHLEQRMDEISAAMVCGAAAD